MSAFPLPARLSLFVACALGACADTPPPTPGDTVQANLDREARLAGTVSELLWDGEIIHIAPARESPEPANAGAQSDAVASVPTRARDNEDGGGHRFIAVHTPVSPDSENIVVLMLHGRGHHPLRANPNDALRMHLADAEIASLAIQLPVLGIGASYNQYLPLLPATRRRISAALDWLAKNYPGSKPHIVAHSCGVHMMMDWIDHHGDARISSFIGLSMHNFIPDQKPPSPYPIERMRVPILDVMAERSAPAVLRRAWLRRAQARSGKASYRQIVFPDTDSTYRHKATELADALIDFLRDQ